MGRIFITGSTDGLGRATAEFLLQNGHDVIVHARSGERLTAAQDLMDRGATGVVGDLSDLEQTRDVAQQVNRSGAVDAVVHNAGVFHGPQILQVNVIAAYVLTALIARPRRLIYLSSGLHRGGRASLSGVTWGAREPGVSYSDSKLYVTALAAYVARRWPDVLSNAVDPGWVPTKMGGPGAPDDLRLGHLTQEWLAVSEDPEALTSGGYWHHQRRGRAHPAVYEEQFQDELADHLARATGVRLA
jgi:NAD(P)-dependent dehydrogenase (short-subunit alcohol dehydrogenase family)